MICLQCMHRIRASTVSLNRISFVGPNRTKVGTLLTARRSETVGNTLSAQLFSNSATLRSPPASSESLVSESRSSVPAGTPLRGLGYFKGKDPPLAKEDHEYPEWLWGLLDEGKKSGTTEGGDDQGDSYSKSKKQRRVAARAALKAAKANPEALVPKVPIEHQSIDLPIGDGTLKGAIEASKSREEVRDAMRKGRRKSIKEGNFLKAMR